MKRLQLALAGLVAASCLPAAFGDQPYYGHGSHIEHYPAQGYGHYTIGHGAGCNTCGGHGYGAGVPGCCDRPISKADHLWDGYCAEKAHGWLGDRCDSGCDSCYKPLFGGLFSLKRNRCSSCTSGHASCGSVAAPCQGGGCSSCTSGGAIDAAPAQQLDAPPAPPANEPPLPPEPPQTGRARSRRAI